MYLDGNAVVENNYILSMHNSFVMYDVATNCYILYKKYNSFVECAKYIVDFLLKREKILTNGCGFDIIF